MANEAGPSNGMRFDFSNSQTKSGGDVASWNKILIQYFIGSSKRADNMKEVLAWLKPHAVDYLPAHEEAHSRQTPGTGVWFFNTRTYTMWRAMDSSEPRLCNLECVGIPGAGKTTLASAVIENLQPGNPPSNHGNQDDPCIVLYVYFRHDTQLHQTIPNVLASLLQQVVQIKRNVSNELYKLYEACSRSKIIPAPDRIVNILRLELSGYRRVFIVVDALDEYSTETYSLSHDLVSHLERLDVRLLITSRHRVDFTPKTFSSLDISAQADDIRLMVLDHVKGNLAKIIDRTASLLEEIVNTVVAKAEGMFMIARLLIESVPHLLTTADIRTALKLLPTGLHDTYLMTMKRIWKQDPHIVELARKVLAWIFHAKRRLRVLELQHAVSFGRKERTIPVEDDMIAEDVILSSCLGLVVFVKNRWGHECQFAHFTTRQFLQTCWQDYFPDGEKQITETCLEYLSVAVSVIPPELTERIILIEHFRDREQDHEWQQYQASRSKLFVYAANFWVAHAKAIDGIDTYASVFEHPISPYIANGSVTNGTSIIPTACMLPAWYWALYFARFGLLEHLQKHASIIQNCTNASLDYSNIRSKSRWTALHFAALHGHLKIVDFLLDNGADVNQLNNNNDSPLHLAVQAGSTGVALVQLLLGHGATVDQPNHLQRAPIFYAISPKPPNPPSIANIRLLLQHEVDIYREDKFFRVKETPLSRAQKSEYPEIKQLLELHSYTRPPKPRTYIQRFPSGYFDALNREPQHTSEPGLPTQMVHPVPSEQDPNSHISGSAPDSLHAVNAKRPTKVIALSTPSVKQCALLLLVLLVEYLRRRTGKFEGNENTG